MLNKITQRIAQNYSMLKIKLLNMLRNIAQRFE